MMHIDSELKSAGPIDRDALGTVERWVLSRLNAATRDVNKNLSIFRSDEAASTRPLRSSSREHKRGASAW